MSTTASPSTDQASALPAPPRQPWRLRRLLAGAAGLVTVAVVVAWIAGLFDSGQARPAGVTDNAYPTSTTSVARGTLFSQLSADGTLQYTTSDGSDYNVINQASGTLTSLPRTGQVFSRGQVLYRVSNDPVILLYGDTPVYRSLYDGETGPDVRELNHNLVALGYATKSEVGWDWDYFSDETSYALEKLQGKLGEDETGTLTEGQAVFLPAQIRITTVDATLGTGAGAGAAIMQATSTSRQVVVNLDASEQSEVKVGDRVQITLPAGNVTPGVVNGVGTVASGGSNPTLPVYITLEQPKAAGGLDRAPVTLEIATARVKHALIVPVDALLALSGGGYAVETVGTDGVHKLVAVSLGSFDDAAGTVQVTGDLTAGQRIVVPSL